MVVKNSKVILTDVDGVLLDWEEGFTVWMEHHGHKAVDGYKLMYKIGERYGISNNEGHRMVRLFNESAAIGFLPPLRDAQYYAKMLAEKHGYRFLAVTSLSTDEYAKELRVRNLNKLFGDVFIDVICLDTGADKDEVLLKLSKTYPHNNFWIEDKPENADAGVAVGFNSILVEHGHNMDYTGDATVVKNWEDIYKLVTEND
jgi:FMN phosphatase YigB (HAD superfamily)